LPTHLTKPFAISQQAVVRSEQAVVRSEQVVVRSQQAVVRSEQAVVRSEQAVVRSEQAVVTTRLNINKILRNFLWWEQLKVRSKLDFYVMEVPTIGLLKQ
jgi:hypothetical protein